MLPRLPSPFRAVIGLFLLGCIGVNSSAAPIELTIDATQPGPAIDLHRFALGQGGLSDKPMFDAHLEAIAQLHPATIRIFVQEFFDLYPDHGRFHWDTLDRVIETILATKAKPILCLCFKPKVLFPKIDQHLVHPNDYAEWEALITQLVVHCNRDRHFGIEYWEIANEPDIGEDGGCPYLFQAADYLTYYTHTAQAIRQANTAAKVGGPALAGYNSAIGTALIEHCGKGKAPLDFFSWHIYSSEPAYFRQSIRDMKSKLAKFPKLQSTETIIDEWNMSLDHPLLQPAFQPAFILETTRAFLEEGLSRSAYYHIRDSFVAEEQFAQFMSPKGAAFVAHWWNDTPQYDGLYDNQGQVRPAYYGFKLLGLLKGARLPVNGTNATIHALAVKAGPRIHVLLWSFPEKENSEPHEVLLRISGLTSGQFRFTRLDPLNRIAPLELLETGDLAKTSGGTLRFQLKPYEIRWLVID